jgi:hypothetical protein
MMMINEMKYCLNYTFLVAYFQIVCMGGGYTFFLQICDFIILQKIYVILINNYINLLLL